MGDEEQRRFTADLATRSVQSQDDSDRVSYMSNFTRDWREGMTKMELISKYAERGLNEYQYTLLSRRLREAGYNRGRKNTGRLAAHLEASMLENDASESVNHDGRESIFAKVECLANEVEAVKDIAEDANDVANVADDNVRDLIARLDGLTKLVNQASVKLIVLESRVNKDFVKRSDYREDQKELWTAIRDMEKKMR